MDPTEHTPPEEGEPGFGRDIDLEKTRSAGRLAAADLSSNEDKAGQEPGIHISPDPDADDPD